MAKKKKARDEDAPKPLPKAPEKLNRPFAEALKTLAEEAKKPAPKETPAPKAAASAPAKGAAPKPAPAPSLTKARPAPARPTDPMSQYGYEDRAAFHQAFAGVRSIEAGKKKAGGKVKAFDPAAMDATKRVVGDAIAMCKGMYEAADGVDALLVVTEWNEFRNPDFERLKSIMRKPAIFDGRNLYEGAELRELGFHYCGIGVP